MKLPPTQSPPRRFQHSLAANATPPQLPNTRSPAVDPQFASRSEKFDASDRLAHRPSAAAESLPISHRYRTASFSPLPLGEVGEGAQHSDRPLLPIDTRPHQKPTRSLAQPLLCHTSHQSNQTHSVTAADAPLDMSASFSAAEILP